MQQATRRGKISVLVFFDTIGPLSPLSMNRKVFAFDFDILNELMRSKTTRSSQNTQKFLNNYNARFKIPLNY